MKALLAKLLYLFNKKDRMKIFILFILILSSTFVEILGFSAIIPFIVTVSKPEIVQENIYVKAIYDWISPNSINGFIVWLALLIIATFVFKNIYLSFIQYYQFSFLSRKHHELSSRLFRSYLNNPYSFHLQRNSAQLLRNTQIVNGVVFCVLFPIITIASSIILILSIMILLSVVDTISALLIFGFIGIISLFYFLVVKKKLKIFGEKIVYLSGMIIKQFNQGLGSIKESKILGREHFFDKSYSQYLYEFVRVSKWQRFINVIPRPLIETSLVALILFVMIFAIARGQNTESVLIFLSFFGMAAIRLMPSIIKINGALSQIRFYKRALDEIYDDLRMSESYKEMLPYKEISEAFIFQKEIYLKNIDFSYNGTKNIALNNLSLLISKNTTVGLVGESGAGKTTTVDLILGLLNPKSGIIYVDDVDIHENLSSWQRKAGYIPQQIYLMDDTIKANVAFGIPEKDIELDKVNNAIKLAQLEKFINELPEGLETTIGESGVRLSGGQRQRIGIARALYNEPELLIMDEATAALDNETERAFMEAIESLSGKRTIIIIAHRLTTVENVDKIFFMSNGALIASGSYEELLGTCCEFRQLAGVVGINVN